MPFLPSPYTWTPNTILPSHGQIPPLYNPGSNVDGPPPGIPRQPPGIGNRFICSISTPVSYFSMSMIPFCVAPLLASHASTPLTFLTVWPKRDTESLQRRPNYQSPRLLSRPSHNPPTSGHHNRWERAHCLHKAPSLKAGPPLLSGAGRILSNLASQL